MQLICATWQLHQEDVNEVEQYVEKLLGIRSVAATHPRIFIYCKGTPVFVAQARDRGFAHEVIELPNVGREQETYLWHIVAHYDRLPEHVFFSQVGLSHKEDEAYVLVSGMVYQNLPVQTWQEYHSRCIQSPRGFVAKGMIEDLVGQGAVDNACQLCMSCIRLRQVAQRASPDSACLLCMVMF